LTSAAITDENIDAMMAYEFTKVIVITRDHEKTIEYLKGKINVLNKYEDLHASTNWILSCHDAERNPYVIVNIQSVDEFDEVTKALKVAAAIDPENAILNIGQ